MSGTSNIPTWSHQLLYCHFWVSCGSTSHGRTGELSRHAHTTLKMTSAIHAEPGQGVDGGISMVLYLLVTLWFPDRKGISLEAHQREAGLEQQP